MGIPAMFRWLSQKYPKIVSAVQEEMPKEVDGEIIPVDRTKPNPNGEEFDNLYLDMNGIVHPCSHPEDKPAPKTEADMMVAIFEYTDRVVGMCRPRRLLYLAVDGVAPRAKMNQQRSRRFRSAREAEEKDAEKAEFMKILTSQKMNKGEEIDTIDKVIEKTWDSNAITPGTPFMFLLAESLQYWVAYKFTTDPSWRDVKVILSDASVPGEGEHKIMNFIRSQRALPTHDANTRHVIYGLDADLIMLGLATHEPHFRVLREDVFFDSGKDKTCNRCGRKGHQDRGCPYPPDVVKISEEDANAEWAESEHPAKPYIWLHVNILREYLAVEMDAPGRQFKYDLERSLDDWVFMCFFVGNDFLPHMPSLEIRDQGIDMLTGIWRELLPRMKDYVTKDGYPDMDSVQLILEVLGGKEADIFQKRKEVSDRQAASRARREAQQAQRNGSAPKRGRFDDNGPPPFKRVKEDTNTYLNAGIPFFSPGEAQSNEVRDVHRGLLENRHQPNKSAAAQLKELMKAKAEGSAEPSQDSEAASTPDVSVSLGKRKSDAVEDSDNGTPGRNTPIPAQDAPKKEGEMPEDTIKLWEPGYEERYYAQKFNVAPDDMEFRHTVAREYAIGLCWVLAYYMQGCPSWTWYFPYHYAPFAQDFVNLGTLNPKKLFETGVPFRPYEQLMGVLPAASNHAIPEPFRHLMSDEDSPIVDFYPKDFVIDLNGKKFAWQGVAILPFIDEKRLLDAMALKYPELSDDEHRRNEVGKETLLFSQENKLFQVVDKAFYRQKDRHVTIDPDTSMGLHGTMEVHDLFVVDSQLVPPFEGADEEEFEITQDRSIRVYYEMPKVESKRAHKSILLKDVIMPPKTLTDMDIQAVKRGSNGRGRGGGFGRGGGGGYNGRGGGGGYNGRGGGGGGYNGNGGRGGGGYGGNDRGGHNNNRGGNNYNNQYPQGGSNWAPPPPPGWNGNNNYNQGPPHSFNPQAQPFERPAWMNQAPSAPPPSNARNDNSLRDKDYYRPADQILGRPPAHGGGNGGGGYGGPPPPPQNYNNRGGYGGNGGRGGGYNGNGGRGGGGYGSNGGRGGGQGDQYRRQY